MVVDDVGRCINPLIVRGQTHGAIVQGVGQALWERSYVDPDNVDGVEGDPGGEGALSSSEAYRCRRSCNPPRLWPSLLTARLPPGPRRSLFRELPRQLDKTNGNH
jgi:hypothetical protein